MTTNREHTDRGAPQRAVREQGEQAQLDWRRANMHAAEGHAGSIPRGNQQCERENLGHRRIEYERVLGH
ncbi:MAG: hypothetical protein ACJ75Z_11760 [Solirubrobacterales bacterium]